MAFSDLFFIDATGFHTSSFNEVLDYVQTNFKNIYGTDTYLGADSQDGQWTSVIAKDLYDSAMLNQSTYNSYPPISAQGVGLSREVKINGLTRQPATFSTVDLLISGTVGTTISSGIAIDTNKQKWDLPATVVIPISGNITVTATSETSGQVVAAPNTVTGIFTPTSGWASVSNPTAASIGQGIETDAQLRIRQQQSTALPSLTVFEGTIGAVANVTGVTMYRGYENQTGSTDVNGIPAHSISMVVEGGDAMAIAQAIQVHKTPGTGTYGNTSETVFDSHGIPITINFQRPTIDATTIAITVAVTPGWTSDYVVLLQDAIAAYINSVGIGNTIFYTKIFVPAYLLGTVAQGTFDIVSLTVNGGTSNVVTAWDHFPFISDPTTIAVTVT